MTAIPAPSDLVEPVVPTVPKPVPESPPVARKPVVTPVRPFVSAPEPVDPAPGQPVGSRSQKMTVNLPVELIDEAKNAFWADRADYRSFSAWVAEALRHQIEQTLRRRRLAVLPVRPGDGLPPGRPLK